MIQPDKITSVRSLPCEETLYALAYDPSSRQAFVAGSDCAIQRFDLANEATTASLSWTVHENYVSALALADVAGHTQLISASYDRHIAWTDPASGQLLHKVSAHSGWIRELRILRSAAILLSLGDDMWLRQWNLQSGTLLREWQCHATTTPQGHVNATYTMAVHPTEQWIATGDRTGEVKIFAATDGSLLKTFNVPTLYTYDPRQRKRSIGGIRSLAFSPCGRFVAAGGIGQIENVDGLAGPLHAEIWDWRAGIAVAILNAGDHQALVNSLEFSADGKWLIGAGGGSSNACLAVWDVLPITSMPQQSETGTPAGAGQTSAAPSAAPAAAQTDGNAAAAADPANSASIAPLKIAAFLTKGDGHIHRAILDEPRNQLLAAGFKKLEVWSCGS